MKLARPLKETDLLDARARDARARAQRHLGGVGPDPRREELSEDLQPLDPERPRHARARRGEVRPHRRRASRRTIRVARGEREVDGKSIMGLLLLAAAQGQRDHDHGRRPGRADAIAALCALVERGFDEVLTTQAAMRLTGLGVSPGIGIGRALVVTRGTANLRFRIPERRDRARARARSTTRARGRAGRSSRSSSGSPRRPAPSTPTCSTRSS